MRDYRKIDRQSGDALALLFQPQRSGATASRSAEKSDYRI